MCSIWVSVMTMTKANKFKLNTDSSWWITKKVTLNIFSEDRYLPSGFKQLKGHTDSFFVHLVFTVITIVHTIHSLLPF